VAQRAAVRAGARAARNLEKDTRMRTLYALAALIAVSPVRAAEPAAPASSDADALAQQLANPVAALISVPFQFNRDTGIGPGGDGSRWTLNFQPVVPFSIGEDWNLITRTILPVIYQSDVRPGGGSQSGVGDVLQSVFLSPKATTGGWIWGAGPAILLPTGSSDFTLDQWAVGPSVVVLRQTEDGWTYGALVNQVWGVSNSGNLPDVNAAFFQPFLVRRIGPGRTLGTNLEATYDHDSGQWTVPCNGSISQILPIGGQLISVGGGVRVYLDRPSGGPDWGLRLSVTLLFPR
jgi:hypothetical protein